MTTVEGGPVHMLKIDEAAAMLGISKRQMYNLAAPAGPIPCYRLGPRLTRFDPADIQAFLLAKKVEHFDPVKVAGQARVTRTIKIRDGESELQKCFQRLRPAKKTQTKG